MTNAETDVDQSCQTWASGDPLEVVNFWWWSGSACGFHHCGMEIFGHLL